MPRHARPPEDQRPLAAGSATSSRSADPPATFRRRTAPALHEARDLPATLSLVETGRWLGISRNTAYQMAREGRFPIRTLQLGGQRRVATCDLLDYLNIPIPYPEETPTVVAV